MLKAAVKANAAPSLAHTNRGAPGGEGKLGREGTSSHPKPVAPLPRPGDVARGWGRDPQLGPAPRPAGLQPRPGAAAVT